MYDIKGSKCAFLGLQGSGKTYAAFKVCEVNNYRTLVATPNRHDVEGRTDNFYLYNPFPRTADEVEKFWLHAKQLALKGQIDVVLFDEMDMIFRNNFDLGKNSVDAFANHRHWGLGIIGIARRAQDIPSYFMESCKFVFAFALQGENVRRKLNGMYKGFGDMVLSLNYEAHEYAVKMIARPPEKKGAI